MYHRSCSIVRRSLCLGAGMGWAGLVLGQAKPAGVGDCVQRVGLGSVGSLAFGGASPQGLLVDLFAMLSRPMGCRFEPDVLSTALLRRAWQGRRAGHGPHWIALLSQSTRTPRLLLMRSPMALVQSANASPRNLHALLQDDSQSFIQMDGSLLGRPFDAWLKHLPPERKQKAADVDSLLGMMAAGRAQVAVLPLLAVESRQRQLKLESHLRLQVLAGAPHRVGQPHFEATGIGFDPSLLPSDAPARMGEALRAMRADGSLATLLARYLDPRWIEDCLLSQALTGSLEVPQALSRG